ncbi:hypothetical protein J7E50_20075 [Pedobacter sp. ISL-68]|uniref:hypothetical protein n=1 Tax=unclassified Pedobacter TaxID=2628915 RepID=UPI001BE57A64|nr:MULTISPECIES: hypothetical protein [unclassified Pedobacter]MBT2561867.1 hypothetical protein [Pedobacter sp. ISL-64]MBT2592525.1 hypothetical protein [Pedobacter sp. ISL-68]
MAKTIFHFRGCSLHKPLFLNPTAAAASDSSIGATANGGAERLQEPQAIHFLSLKCFFLWSAEPVQNAMFLPVLRFYASLPRSSLLQGNASTGAKWQKSFSFLGLQGAQTLFLNPTAAAASDSSIGTTANGGLSASKNHRPFVS